MINPLNPAKKYTYLTRRASAQGQKNKVCIEQPLYCSLFITEPCNPNNPIYVLSIPWLFISHVLALALALSPSPSLYFLSSFLFNFFFVSFSSSLISLISRFFPCCFSLLMLFHLHLKPFITIPSPPTSNKIKKSLLSIDVSNTSIPSSLVDRKKGGLLRGVFFLVESRFCVKYSCSV